MGFQVLFNGDPGYEIQEGDETHTHTHTHYRFG